MQLPKAFILFALLVLTLACQATGVKPDAAPKMSFEEARDVVLRMQSIPMAPPPRKMDDILNILDQPEGRHAHMRVLFQRAEMRPPTGLPSEDMYHFYKSRANARYELYRFKAAAEDLRQAIAYAEQTRIRDSFLYRRLAELELRAGRYDDALDLSKKALTLLEGRGFRIGPYLAFQSRIHRHMGHFVRARFLISRAYSYYSRLPAATRYSLILDGGEIDIGNENDILIAEAELLETQGLHARAHEKRVQVLSYQSRIRHKRPIEAVYAELDLAGNLLNQGRLVEAEKEARWGLKHAVDIYGRESGITAAALQALGEVLLAKGDLDNAKTLAMAQSDILGRLKLDKGEDVLIRARIFAADVLCTDYDFAAAMETYDLALEGMRSNVYLYRRYARRNTGLILALIENRRIREARELIRQARSENRRLEFDGNGTEGELKALEALALYRELKLAAARSRFAEAVPGLLATIQDTGSDYAKRRRADLLLNRYIEMLLELYSPDKGQAAGDRVIVELFRLADVRQSRVDSALGESSARAASLADPQLAELVRQEQDAAKKNKSLKAAYYNAVAAKGGGQDRELTDLENNIHALTAARASILARIATEFPKYSGYVKPQPPSIAAVQARLGTTEALLSIWTLEKKTCVWVIPPTGRPAFGVVDLGRQALAEKVNRLRQSLKPDAGLLSDIPAFDTETAYSLYAQLLEPIAGAWRGATDLIVVVKGPLDQLPLGVLPTAPVSLSGEDAVRFDSYRAVPWLIKRFSITRLPSAAALLTLRSLPAADANREAFIGFGDPVFNPEQLETAGRPPARLARRGSVGKAAIQIRGIRVTEEGLLDNADITSVGLEQLNRLPDTAIEIRDIADSLGADHNRDIYLGVDASEANVKARTLSHKKIVAFATHALLPGDIDGLAQPALAFSSPDVTGKAEDGLLTMGEVLALKLDADLVVLSACDSGAAEGGGAEAVSGLGRAFFYSGARALLVTMWPVETTSANKLTTGLFRLRAREGSLPWARALQQSMLELIDDPGLRHPDGSVAARYAHPLFWGAFVVVGDSGHR